MGLNEGLSGVSTGIIDYVGENPVKVAVGVGATALGAGVLAASVIRKKSNKRTHKISHTRRGWKQDRKRKSKQKWEVAYRKKKKRLSRSRSMARRGVHYTKKGQPYIYKANGQTRFIKGKRRKR